MAARWRAVASDAGLRGKVRELEGREAVEIIDSQSVWAAAMVPATSRDYDGGKRAPGRQWHSVTLPALRPRGIEVQTVEDQAYADHGRRGSG